MRNYAFKLLHRKKLLLFVILLLCLPEVSAAKRCKEYRSCAEVISDFPSGNFGKKDRDKDGIPCENVCRSTKQVKALLKAYSGSKNADQ